MKVTAGAVLAVTLMVVASHSAAQMAVATDMTPAEAAAVLAPSPGAATGPAGDGQAPVSPCCVVPANTPVSIELAEPVNVKKASRAGDHFAIRLKDPIVVNGAVVVPAGATGFGVVLQVGQAGVTPLLEYRKPKLVLDAREIVYNGRHVPLVGLQLAHTWNNDPAFPSPPGGRPSLGLDQLVAGRLGYPAGTVGASRVSDTQPETGAAQAPAPEAGSPKVHLFRTKYFGLSSLTKQEYYADGVRLASVDAGQCVTVHGAPGRHLLTEKFRGQLTSNLDVELPVAWSGGMDYYYVYRVNFEVGRDYLSRRFVFSLQEVSQPDWDRAATRCGPKQ